MRAWMFELMYGVKDGDNVSIVLDGETVTGTYRNIGGEAQIVSYVATASDNDTHWTVKINNTHNPT